MKKKRYESRYELFRDVLLQERISHKITQGRLADMLGVKQSYVSKTENGDRRLDVIELLEMCEAMGVLLTDFVFRLETRLLNEGLLSPERRADYFKWQDIYETYYDIKERAMS